MEEQAPTTEITEHTATCEVDGSCASCSTCATGICPGTLLVGAMALIWFGAVIGAKLFGKKTPPNDG